MSQVDALTRISQIEAQIALLNRLGQLRASDSIWSNPITAADATAGWLKGRDTIPGYGRASAGVQSILRRVGQSPEAQIAALQHSGWASNGYPDLPALYRQVSG